MVGLSVVLEGQNSALSVDQNSQQVISKATLNKMIASNNRNKKAASSSSSSSSYYYMSFGSTFLDRCYLCRQELLPDKDIYMYKGDRAFCSEECRCRHIFMDEEDIVRQDNCSLAAANPTTPSSSSSRRGNKKRGAFAF